jgi:hypothetical protein
MYARILAISSLSTLVYTEELKCVEKRGLCQVIFVRVTNIEIDTLEYQQTEKIETELKDVDRIQIRKVYACCPGWHSGGSSFSSPLINEDLPAGPQLVFTLNIRFFRHQACYSLLPAKPGGQADRVISLCKYKGVGY